MRLDFLSANGVRLSKTYKKTGHGIDAAAYPFVKNFTSHTVEVNTPEDFHRAAVEHADQGHCLLKGTLAHPVVDQSRAGLTNTNAATSWICIDYDRSDGFSSVDELLVTLDPALANTTYIFQHSASAGVKGPVGLRGHAFFLLETPVLAPVLRQWLTGLNYKHAALRERLELSTNGLGLRFPLDVSTCQNDKLIYIAPPTLEGIEDPLPSGRIELRKRTHDFLQLNPVANAQWNREQHDTVVAELRASAGLKKRAPKYTNVNGIEILTNPDAVMVTGIRDRGDYISLNLNGGDSWAYWVRASDPELVHNFKGEPAVRLADVAPELYEQLAAKPAATDQVAGTLPLAFRDRETDTYYNGFYSPTTNLLELSRVASKPRIQDFYKDFGAEPPGVIPDWQYTFDPTRTEAIDVNAKWANQFVPTPYMRNPGTSPVQIPNVINRVLLSICGGDEEFKDHFVNWLSYVFKNRQKAQTAFLFHGVEGTGKGLLFEKILTPLFSSKYVLSLTMNRFEDSFNAEFETALLAFCDEANLADTHDAAKIFNKVKNMVTEETFTIRAMRQNAVSRRNYCSFIFASNQANPMEITPTDRRFNVAPRQTDKLTISHAEVLLIEDELQLFAGYLHGYPTDIARVRTILHNDARQEMMDRGVNSVDGFFRAINAGDLEYFLQFVKTSANLFPDQKYLAFYESIQAWVKQAHAGGPQLVPRDQLEAVYSYLQNTQVTPTKFSRMARLKDVEIVAAYCRDQQRTVRGARVTWNIAPELLIEYMAEAA